MEKKYVKSPMNYTDGKYKLLPQILPFFPSGINTFVDLFTGGGNIAVNVDANKIIANDNVMFSKGKTNDLLIEWSEKYNVHHLDYTYQNCNYHTKDKETKPDEVLITNY